MQDSTPIGRGIRCGLAAGCALAVAAGPGAAAAAAADPGFTCRASTVRAQLLTGDPIEPLAANRLGARCADDTVGLENLGGALPGDLGLDLAFASTATNGAAVPAARVVESRAAAALVRVPGTGGVLTVEGVSTRVTGSCAGGVARLAGASSVARITLAGQELPTDQVVTQVLNGVGGTPLGAILRIVPGEEVRSGAGADAALTRRALHVTIAAGGQNLVDAVLGEASAGTADSACTTTTVPGGGDGGGGNGSGGSGGSGGDGTGVLGDAASGRPVAGYAFGGGRAVTLADLARLGVGRNHPCRNRRYGRNVALVGTKRRDRMSGSNFADRMFGFRRGDTLSGAVGRDCIDGARGRDRLSGSLGRDFLIGAAGRDRLWGGPGSDKVRGGKGRDVVNGESGTDRLRGGRGNDTLNAGFGRDRVWGGRGNDTINASVAGPRQVVDCGRGRDEVRLNYNDRQRNCERVLRIH